jgi:hypothetical protein
MPKYEVTVRVTGAMFVTVEADSPEQARERAEEHRPSVELCIQCSGYTSAQFGDEENPPFDLELDDFNYNGAKAEPKH